ncbi:hypothetical protein AJ80_02385 [Polytolypa hystricis UAMH7299]|uniref:Rab-GAP TBC domain-containing protein n=1 Tax=Polytolypa hystricis (strain UAMH7299) TaxID=1447883 RepID=A0A2B7YHN6_POLH7|nr:hypothetical protein AJ80_02385 [Polytolypa hystricis UAMH7299]
MDVTANPRRESHCSLPAEREPLPTDSMVTVPLSDPQLSPRELEPEYQLLDSPTASQDAEPSTAEKHDTPRKDDVVVDRTSKARSRSTESYSSVRSRSTEEYKEADDREENEQLNWETVEIGNTKPKALDGEMPAEESTDALVARLERENEDLAGNPKSGIAKTGHPQTNSTADSVIELKKLANDPSRSSLRFSQVPTPPLTDLEFWATLVADYQNAIRRFPTLIPTKICAGIPPPLRGIVWPVIAGAADPSLRTKFERLSGETSPYEGLIEKDIGRSFPNVEMFRDPNGEGQQMMAKVLKCFSIHDKEIGYCQGLGFVVGPLLMHMNDVEAFCVLVRLMDHYDLRSCFLPSLSGLHLRIYQFQALLSDHLKELDAHLKSLNIEPVYVSQWFMSFFAVTCPLPMLLRIYDVLLHDGACVTLMRVALSLMRRNEKKLLACNEFEDVMQLLLSRSLWDPYGCNADDLVVDFVSLSSIVTPETLDSLESDYKESKATSQGVNLLQLESPTSKFWGKFWPGSSGHNSKALSLNPGNSAAGSCEPNGVRRTPSKQSMASTLNSFESISDASTAPTEASITNDRRRTKPSGGQNKDRDLHTQIEDLLVALTDMQREQAALAKELQREREEREEDLQVARLMFDYIKEQGEDEKNAELLAKGSDRFTTTTESRRMSTLQTKQQLREDVTMWKDKHTIEAGRCRDLNRRLDEHEQDNTQLREQLRETRNRLQESHNQKQRLEKTVQELRQRKSSGSERHSDSGSPSDDRPSSGLREFKLGRTPTFSKRSSSLGISALLPASAESNNTPPPAADESLLLELVNSKTGEAVARQELEEVRAKLESLRKLMLRDVTSVSPRPSPVADPSATNLTLSLPVPGNLSNIYTEPQSRTPSPATSAAGGFFSGWTKRTPSTSNVNLSVAK